MRRTRVYVDEALVTGATVILPETPSEHLTRVLRLGLGDSVILFNGDGGDYAGEIASAQKRAVAVSVGERTVITNESPLRTTLAQAMARGEKMDLILQKATELGVTRIVPLITERTEVRLDEDRVERRLAHWRGVLMSAAEQCGRTRLPELAEPQKLAHWAAALDDTAGLRLALVPGSDFGFGDLPLPLSAVTVVVGPEGGLSDSDQAALRQALFRNLRLGPRVLRTETAGLAALAVLQALAGDFS